MASDLYAPINSSETEVRLLYLHPAHHHDAEIVCDLVPVKLSTKPEFEALSYTWGYDTPSIDISLNESKFKVRENAAAALRRLRLPFTTRRLWIDAICINQGDSDETGGQIKLMQLIYGEAKQVCLWLGDITEDGIIGIKHLRHWSLLSHRDMFSSQYKLGTFKNSANNHKVQLMEEQQNGEVRELLDRPWWRRTWVIQEVVLAKKVTIMCGPETVEWESIQKLFDRLRWTNFRLQLFGIPLEDKDSFPDQTYRLISDYRERWHRAPSSVDLFDVLYRFRRLDCSQNEDKIFGFLGIAPLARTLNIRPGDPVAEVYHQFARDITQATQCLDILNCKREWRGVKRSSAVIESYSLANQARYHDTNALIYDKSGKQVLAWARLPDGWERIQSDTKVVFYSHQEDRTFEKSPLEGVTSHQAQGLKKQRVLPAGWKKRWDNLGRARVEYDASETAFETKMKAESEKLLESLSKLPSWVPNWYSPTDWDPAPLIDHSLPQPQYWASGSALPRLHSVEDLSKLCLDGIIFDQIEDLAEPWHPESHIPPFSRRGNEALISWEILASMKVDNCPYKDKRKNATWRTMIADLAGDNAAPAGDAHLVEAWYDRVGWAKDIPDLSGLSFRENAKIKFDIGGIENKMTEHYLEMRPPQYTGFFSTIKKSVMEGLEVPKKYGMLLKRIHRVCAHRALFVTRKGYIGLAPWNAKSGDLVMILCGGKTPYLARSATSGVGYELVGEAFVYGIMGGEALQAALMAGEECGPITLV